MTDKEMADMTARYRQATDAKTSYIDKMKNKYGDSYGHYMSKEELEHLDMQEDRIRDIGKEAVDNAGKIPLAPFEKNWHELCMKRMLRYAVENGFDRVAWTTGEQQGKRYNLARVVQTVSRDFGHDEDRYFRIAYNHDSETGFYVKPDGTIYYSIIGFNVKHVDEVFGKELAPKVMALEVGETMAADELTIGNKGLVAFYDRILPSFVNSYCKKWGVQVGTVSLPHLSRANDFITEQLTMHCIDVTPAMRESVLQGQPMFMRGDGGMLYGCTLDGTVYLSARELNPETLVH